MGVSDLDSRALVALALQVRRTARRVFMADVLTVGFRLALRARPLRPGHAQGSAPGSHVQLLKMAVNGYPSGRPRR